MIDRSRDVENPESKLLLKGLVISPPRKKECEKRKDGSDHFLCRPEASLLFGRFRFFFTMTIVNGPSSAAVKCQL